MWNQPQYTVKCKCRCSQQYKPLDKTMYVSTGSLPAGHTHNYREYSCKLYPQTLWKLLRDTLGDRDCQYQLSIPILWFLQPGSCLKQRPQYLISATLSSYYLNLIHIHRTYPYMVCTYTLIISVIKECQVLLDRRSTEIVRHYETNHGPRNASSVSGLQ